MKVGIVVPFSWSFWGAVVEHAELQAAALEDLGHDVRLIMGNDPPGQFTRVLHPRVGRHGDPPATLIPVGRSVIVPANGSLPNIVLSPRSFFRLRSALERERFDVLHLHEPMTPAICTAALVAPSLGQESFGMVLTRAFACALPAIASDIPGYREVLEPSASVAVSPDDPGALVSAVEALVADEPARERMGRAARELAVARYSWPRIASRLEAIYASLVGEELRRAA